MASNLETTLIPKKKKKRCPVCNKKLGLFDYTCRCGNNYCIKHRMPEDHKCSFGFQDEVVTGSCVYGHGEDGQDNVVNVTFKPERNGLVVKFLFDPPEDKDGNIYHAFMPQFYYVININIFILCSNQKTIQFRH